MLKRIHKISKSTVLILLLGGISVMPWLGYLEVPVINEDYLILSWFDLQTVLDGFRTFFEQIVGSPYWRPVVWTATSITKYFAGYNAWPYHLTNILVYGVIVFAFFNFLKRIGFARRQAWLGAFIFAVLPSHELAVAWIAGRTDTIMAMFLLFGMNNLVYAFKDRQYYFVPAVIFFLFAMLSKEPAYAVPAMPFLFLLLQESKLSKEDYKSALFRSIILAGLVVIVLLYRLIVIGGTPFESSNFSNINFLDIFKNFFLYIPISFVRADQLEKFYYFLIANKTALWITISVAIVLLVLMVLRYRKMELHEKNLLLFGFLWYIVFILPAVTFFGQWYAFTASMGLIIMTISFLKLNTNNLLGKYVFYLILTIGIIVSVINSQRSEKWLEASERAQISYQSIHYTPMEKDTMIFLAVPDKLNHVNMMKIGFTQAIWHHLHNNHIEVSSPLRLELTDDSFISIEKTGDNEIEIEVVKGRFLPVGSHSRSIVINEKLHYEDGFQKFDIETLTKPLIVSKAKIIIKKKTLLNRVLIFDGTKFLPFNKLEEQFKQAKNKKK